MTQKAETQKLEATDSSPRTHNTRVNKVGRMTGGVEAWTHWEDIEQRVLIDNGSDRISEVSLNAGLSEPGPAFEFVAAMMGRRLSPAAKEASWLEVGL